MEASGPGVSLVICIAQTDDADRMKGLNVRIVPAQPSKIDC